MGIKIDQVQNIFNQEGCMKGEPMKIHLREDVKLCSVMIVRHTVSTSTKSKN